MEFTAPVLNYAQLAPILIVLGGALIGVLIEAFAPRASRHSSQLFITIASLVAAFAALVRVRNQASVDAAMGSVAFDGAGVLLQGSILIIALLSVFHKSQRSSTSCSELSHLHSSSLALPISTDIQHQLPLLEFNRAL